MPDLFDGGFNPFSDILESEPRAGYFAYQNQVGSSPNQKKWFQNAFSQVQDQYLGQLGQQLGGNQLPTLRFADFLKNYDFQGQYNQLTPTQQGRQTSDFNPFTRWAW